MRLLNLFATSIVLFCSRDPKRKYFTRDTLQTAPPFHIAGLVFLSVTFHLKHLAVLCSPSSAVECLKIGKKYNVRMVRQNPHDDERNNHSVDFLQKKKSVSRCFQFSDQVIVHHREFLDRNNKATSRSH